MTRSSGRRVASFALGALLLGGCGQPGYTTAEQLFEAAGGESWCGGPLTLRVEPWNGVCGPQDDRVVVGIAVAAGELVDSLNRADEGLVVLVPEDRDTLPGWQLRARDRDRLDEARERIGGVVLEDREAIEDWLGDDLVPTPSDGAGTASPTG